MDRPIVVIVDADDRLRRTLKNPLARRGFDVTEVVDGDAALRALDARRPQLLIVGSPRPGAGDGLDVVRQLRACDRTVPIVLLVGESSEARVIDALRAGVNDYLTRPVSDDELVLSVDRCVGDRPAARRLSTGPAARDAFVDGDRLVGDSPCMRAIALQIRRLASTDSNVLITGETGTGKELVAELLHRNSRRRTGPLVCINCPAIPESLLESELFGFDRGAFTGAQAAYEGKLRLAHGGTLFFDEIGDMSLSAQAKILRVVEAKELHRLGGTRRIALDVRIVAATNHELEALVAQGRFRRDLYFRLNVASVHLPPLRERTQDIPALLQHYLGSLVGRPGSRITGFAPDALECLQRHAWAGNVRELRNLVEAVSLTAASGVVTRTDLPAAFRRGAQGWPDPSPPAEPAGNERERLLSALLSTNWNKSRVAQELHWARMTVYRKMAKYHITRGGKTPPSATESLTPADPDC
jgi:DNA-binding NtrC family response regulator